MKIDNKRERERGGGRRKKLHYLCNAIESKDQSKKMDWFGLDRSISLHQIQVELNLEKFRKFTKITIIFLHFLILTPQTFFYQN